MVQTLFRAVIAIVTAEFIFNTILTVLNIKASRNPIPDCLSDIYDSTLYARQQKYSMMRRKFSLVSSTFGTMVTLALFAFGGFAMFDTVAQRLSGSPVVQTLIFWGIFYIVSWIVNIPFDIWSTFSIEERFGFNKTSPKTFVADLFKDLALNMVLLGAIMSLCCWIYHLTPEYFWLLAWGAITVFSLFLQYFYSQLIVPIFNRQTPLGDGELRDAIESFAGSVDFKVKDIYVMDSSKRTTHANAYFTGFGKKKRIVLYDTLIEQLSTDEIVSVLSHEIGHAKHHHTILSTLLNSATSLLMLYLFNLVIGSDCIAAAAGASKASFHLNLAVFSLLYTPVNILFDILSNALSRRHERQADRFAGEHGCGKSLVSGLKKLSARSLANLTPHPVTVFVEYSHPTLYERVTALSSDRSPAPDL